MGFEKTRLIWYS